MFCNQLTYGLVTFYTGQNRASYIMPSTRLLEALVGHQLRNAS